MKRRERRQNKRRPQGEGSRRRAAVLAAVAAHALPHRHLAARVAHDLGENIRLAERRQVTAYLTHTNLAARRGRQHRNTSRIILRELESLGLVKSYGFRKGLGVRFVVRWSNVFQYAAAHQCGAMSNAAAKARGVAVRTADDWQAAYTADKQRQAAKRAAAEQRHQAAIEANRQAIKAHVATPADQAAHRDRMIQLRAITKAAARNS